jgi:GntR family transcriptional repressor for pyruvate dehydrogenase complex
LEPIKKTRMSEDALEQIKDLILSQDLGPGDKLPSERNLVQILGISRAPVREALRMLEIVGMVEVRQGKGVFVKNRNSDLSVPLQTWLSDRKEALESAFETRLLLEPAAAQLAAFRARDKDLEAMEQALHQFFEGVVAQNIVKLIEADMRFHALIAAASGNKTIHFIMETLTRFVFEGWKATLRSPGRAQRTIEEHAQIFEAIKKGDAKGAAEAMRLHLEDALVNLKEAGL